MNEATYERKPLLALTASMLMPGLGQVYNGELMKGLSLFLCFAFVLPVFSWLALHGPEAVLWLVVIFGTALALFMYCFSMRDAYRTAASLGAGYRLEVYNKPYAYVAILFFGYFFVLNQLTQYTKTWFLEAYHVPSKSMTPNVLRGDRFFVDKRVNFPGAKNEIRRGDATIFVYPNNRTQVYIKRVIGLPGDQIEIKDMDLIVNGKSVRGQEVHELGSSELDALLQDHVAYQEMSDQGQPYTVLWKKGGKRESLSLTVPNGQVFVMGDNRDDSRDSRFFGTVPLTDVIAKAKQVWFSKDSEAGIRWGRLGRILDVNPSS